MRKITFYLFAFILVGCQVDKKSIQSAFFSGEIVNPTNNYVVLYKDEIVIDSAKLDENNRFTLRLDQVDEGLYHFDHHPELQYVYLEKGDSLMIRLNTSDFDESLVFSGTGEVINNFLLEMFLTYEEEEPLINEFYELEPEAFSKKIDSLRQSKFLLLKELENDMPLSDKALEIAKANIDYTYYAYYEKYPFKHRRKLGEKSIHELSSNFYGYRKNINYNNTNLTYFRPYYNYMIYNIGNMSYMDCAEECKKGENKIKNQLHYNLHKLKLIDSLVKENSLRDNLFRNVAMDYLLKVHDNEENNNLFINDFHKRSGNNKHIAEIDGLYTGIQNIQPGNKIPDLELWNTNGEKVSLREVTGNKNIVLYFWTGTQKRQFENINKRVQELQAKNKDVIYIGINYKTEQPQWTSIVEKYELDKDNQFRSDNFEELTNSLIIYPTNKCILMKDGVIVNAFENLYSIN
ncbi:TlpA family protein disulfide reductase [Sediminicola sp. 1XM1-17]|uniref:TlpA family protein disulfide reductase n=1 Tax=Sediminicola sp. 1XM1-17 TaxID=3127702 RepID=UPI003077736A